MASVLSFHKDRSRYAAMARSWRAQEAQALAAETQACAKERRSFHPSATFSPGR